VEGIVIKKLAILLVGGLLSCGGYMLYYATLGELKKKEGILK